VNSSTLGCYCAARRGGADSDAATRGVDLFSLATIKWRTKILPLQVILQSPCKFVWLLRQDKDNYLFCSKSTDSDIPKANADSHF